MARAINHTFIPKDKTLKCSLPADLKPEVGKNGRHVFYQSPGERRRQKAQRSLRRGRNQLPEFQESRLAQIFSSEIEEARRLEAFNASQLLHNDQDDDEGFVGTIIIALHPFSGRIIILRDIKKQMRDPETGALTIERWNFPGGHREFGETLAEAAVREMREETGIDILKHRLSMRRIGSIKLRRAHDSRQVKKSAIFLVLLTEQAIRDMKPGEEQEKEDSIMLADPEVIDFFIEGEPCNFTPNHINVWRLYKKQSLEQSEKKNERP